MITPSTYDVIIVGARCAGAATALRLARAGLRVLVLERQEPGTDTLSTHALMRTAVLLLDRWGVADTLLKAGTPPVRTTTFRYDGKILEIPIKPSHGIGFLIAPRRLLLDRVLQDAALQAGAEIRYGVTVGGLLRTPQGRVCGVSALSATGTAETFCADQVIGADGRHSFIAAAVGAAAEWTGWQRSAALYAYWEGLPDQGYEWHYRPGVATGVIPTDGGLSCAFVLIPAAEFKKFVADGLQAAYGSTLAASCPELAMAMKKGRQVGRVRGFAGQVGHLRQAYGPGWSLVGDAGYYKDPITAHGITDALRDAELLSAAILDGRAEAWSDYARLRANLSWPLIEATERIASFQWTMTELEALHQDLNQAMRAEFAVMSSLAPPASPAPSADVRHDREFAA